MNRSFSPEQHLFYSLQTASRKWKNGSGGVFITIFVYPREVNPHSTLSCGGVYRHIDNRQVFLFYSK